MKRQKIIERDNFTFEERMHIYKKSKGRCAHCGKRIEFGGEATVEHFVPLSKGGTNRDINIVMTCKKCNDEKGNKIIAPENYLKYLNKKDYEALEGYFDSYIKSFEYMERHNLLACDEYNIYVYPEAVGRIKKKNMTKQLMEKISVTYVLKRVMNRDELPAIKDFYAAYLERNDVLDSREAADINIEFWYRMGVIYYIEKDKEIKLICPIVISSFDGFASYGLDIFIFSGYSNNTAKNIVRMVATRIPEFVMGEQNIGEIKVTLSMLKNDTSTVAVMGIGYPVDRGIWDRFYECIYKLGKFKDKTEEELDIQEKQSEKFFGKFIATKEEVLDFAEDNPGYAWMCETIYPGITQNDYAMRNAHNAIREEYRKTS